MTYLPQKQSGYSAYEDRFGEVTIDRLPCVLDLECSREYPACFCVELGDYLSRCVAENKRATLRGYVDAIFYDGKSYVFGDISETDFDTFIQKCESLNYDV